MSQPLLEGQIETEEMQEIRAMRNRLETLEDSVENLGEQVRQIVGAAAFLKKQLAPVFSGKNGEPVSVSSNDAVEKWKNRFGPTGARLIEVLEVGPATRNRLRPALNCGWSTLDVLLKKFKDVGLIEKDGDNFRLRA